jgi:contractile injection system tube protein
MPESVHLEKAELRQLDSEFKSVINPDKATRVQFNPETLKVTFANQIAQPSGAGDQSGPAAQQFVGAGSTKLALTLWFDVTAPVPEGLPQEDDVRKLTQRVAYFITPQKDGDKFVPPATRFIWGSFQFDGIMEGLEESLEFFSSDGKPLRASLQLSLTQQRITLATFAPRAGGLPAAPGALGGGLGTTPGARPLTQAAAGATLQGLADAAGRGGDWQSIAAANGIENPRLLQPGQLIDLRASVRA